MAQHAHTMSSKIHRQQLRGQASPAPHTVGSAQRHAGSAAAPEHRSTAASWNGAPSAGQRSRSETEQAHLREGASGLSQ